MAPDPPLRMPRIDVGNAAVTTRSRQPGGAQRSGGGRPPSERHGQLVDTLWFLAWLSTGNRTVAEQAVFDALAGSFADPGLSADRPASVWAVLVRHLEGALHVAEQTGALDAPSTATGPTPAQREAVALVLAGHRREHVAVLLDIPLAQLHRDLRAGLHALRETLLSGQTIPADPQSTRQPDVVARSDRESTVASSRRRRRRH